MTSKIAGETPAAETHYYRLDDYIVKRITANEWEIYHHLATVDQKTAMAFVRGEIDPATLPSLEAAATNPMEAR